MAPFKLKFYAMSKQEYKMAETQPSKSERKRERQPISVPFAWEERPGMPKKDWRPNARQIKPAAPPVKLLVSIPFGWEEKPGTPFPSFAQPPTESAFAGSQEHSIIQSSPPNYSDHGCGNWSASVGSNDGQGNVERDGSSDSELDTCSLQTYDSFSSAKSLLANGLISTTAISRALPMQQSSLALTTTDSEQLQSPGSPASQTDGSTSSYATGKASLVGASFLEWFFPLLAPNSIAPNKLRCLENYPSQEAGIQGKEFLHESNYSQVRRPLLTLGELIVMSRRRSCQRKVVKMHKQRSMDLAKRKAFGCFFGISTGINGLHMKLKRQLQLKLM